MSFNDLIAADVRLAILQFLSEGGYSQNDSILNDLLKRTGRMIPHDKTRTELAWLREQGLITVEDIYDTLVATITQRGLDVANGLATVPGVNRPAPPKQSGSWLER
jgi:hypothetical protein